MNGLIVIGILIALIYFGRKWIKKYDHETSEERLARAKYESRDLDITEEAWSIENETNERKQKLDKD